MNKLHVIMKVEGNPNMVDRLSKLNEDLKALGAPISEDGCIYCEENLIEAVSQTFIKNNINAVLKIEN